MRQQCVSGRMTRMKLKWLVLFISCMALAGCWNIKNHGMGDCREYKPMCPGMGERVCTIGKKGCEVCTCVEMNGKFPEPLRSNN